MRLISNYIKRIISKKIIRDLSTVFFENILTKIFNFISILILTRRLGPEGYGKYSFIFVSIAFISSIFDFGMENTAVRFSSKNKELANQIFGLYLTVKGAILITLIIFITIFYNRLLVIMNKGDLAIYIPIIVLGLIGESLIFVNDTYLQSVQRFKFRALINITRYIIALSIIGMLLFFNKLTFNYVVYIFILPLFLSLIFIPRYISFIVTFCRQSFEKRLLKEIFKYQKWMIGIAIANNFITRIDFFMLSIWVGYTQIGIYNAATQLCAVVSFLPYVLGMVLLPKLSEKSEMEVYNTTIRGFKVTIILGVMILLFIPLAPKVVLFFLGRKYQDAMLITEILLVAFDLSLIFLPLEQALYSMGKPKVLTIAKFIHIGILVVLNCITIPFYGYIYAAINVLITRGVYYSIITYLFFSNNKYNLKNGLEIV